MNLSTSDLNDLALFFSRRMDLSLTAVAPARTDTEAKNRELAWFLALEEAQESATLSALFLKIRRKHPEDLLLQEATDLLTDPGRPADRLLGMVLFATAAGFLLTTALGATVGIALWSQPTDPQLAELQPQSTSEHAEIPAITVSTMGSDVPIRHELRPSSRCAHPEGGRVGYWYGGADMPGRQGDIVTIKKAINVRVDFPDRHNHYNARAHIECVLQAGDRVRISAPPVAVPGDRYWVPLETGDLLPKPRTASLHFRRTAAEG